MGEPSSAEPTVASIRLLVKRLASEVIAVEPGAAAVLGRSVEVKEPDALALLEMRSALISTRSAWEGSVPPRLADEARRVIAASKRLAITIG